MSGLAECGGAIRLMKKIEAMGGKGLRGIGQEAVVMVLKGRGETTEGDGGGDATAGVGGGFEDFDIGAGPGQ